MIMLAQNSFNDRLFTYKDELNSTARRLDDTKFDINMLISALTTIPPESTIRDIMETEGITDSRQAITMYKGYTPSARFTRFTTKLQ